MYNNIPNIESESKSNDIKVSVIIPTYNRADYLMKAVFSVQQQTVDNIEIIICDDGSTDETKERIKEIAKADSRIVYIDCGHNGRPAVPRNIGISKSRGKWLAFLDDDDTWNPVKLEIQLYELNRHNAKACCTNAFIYENNRNTGTRYFEGLKDKEYSFRNLISVNPVINSSMIIHRSLIKELGGFPEEENHRAIEDYALWYRIVGYTNIVYIDKPLVGYLMTSTSSIRKEGHLTFEEQKAIIEKQFEEWLEDKDNTIKKYYQYERTVHRYMCLLNSIVSPMRSLKAFVKKL